MENIIVDIVSLCNTFETYRLQRNRFVEDIEKLNSIVKMLEQGMISSGGEKAIEVARVICNQANEQLQQMDAATAFVRAKYEAYLAEISGTIV